MGYNVAHKSISDKPKHMDGQTCPTKYRGVDTGGSDLVFSHLKGNPIQNFNRAWWATLREAGIEDFHFHDLRHTFCSNLIVSGAGLKDAKELIGHKDISMTDRYSHLTIEHQLTKQLQLSEYYAQKEQS